ncbi:MAG: hypothetical protein H7256_05600 [Bdellovibrio sp.]|nr:hypothetical protein [Bdellovibrio sp.]
MKNKIEVTFSKIMFATSIFIFSLLLSKTGFAQASYELTCRNKAKEIAADTYKGCMTEQRQVQIEQIRKDYKDKLSKLKNHYDKELKKLSSGGSVQASNANASASQANSNDGGPEIVLKKTGTAKAKARASGARLPEKKTTVSTQVIDLSSPIDSQINTQEEPVQSQSRIKSSDDNEAEVVELPTQE